MKKIIFKNSRNLNLVGDFYPANSDSIIIFLHGFTGDRSEYERFDKTAISLNNLDFNVLNFDFSGCGESDDDSLTIEKQIDDFKSALNFVTQKGFSKIGVLGLSLGGLISTKTWDERVGTMVLWAHVTNSVSNPRNRYTEEQLKELDDSGVITKIKEKGLRKKVVIDKQMLEDRRNINQKDLLSRIMCPVLIIHGNSDDRVPVADSKSAMQYLSADSKLEIIDNANHYFHEQLEQFIELTISWFEDKLK